MEGSMSWRIPADEIHRQWFSFITRDWSQWAVQGGYGDHSWRSESCFGNQVGCFPWCFLLCLWLCWYFTCCECYTAADTKSGFVRSHCTSGYSLQDDFPGDIMTETWFGWIGTRMVISDVGWLVVFFAIPWFFEIPTMCYSGRVHRKWCSWTVIISVMAASQNKARVHMWGPSKLQDKYMLRWLQARGAWRHWSRWRFQD